VIAAAGRAIELGPGYSGMGFRFGPMCTANINLDRLAQAAEAFRVGLERTTDNDSVHLCGFRLAFLNGDPAGMEAMIAWAMGKPAERNFTHLQALVLARAGQLQASRRLTDRAANLATQARQLELAATYQSAAAVSAALAGDLVTAKRLAATVLNASRARDPQYAAALALALAGDIAQAQSLTNDLEKRFPEDTSSRYFYVPSLRAITAISRGNAANAIEVLRPSESYEMAMPSISFTLSFGGRYPMYARGLAYLAGRQPNEAAAELQKILDRRGLLGPDPMGAVTHLQLARALAASGDKDKAKVAYDAFLELWKDADPDVPILAQSKAEYAKLK
jgi:hypothetical protein